MRAKYIVEHGCGTGSNADYLKRNLVDDCKFLGLDWAKSPGTKIFENTILYSELAFKVNSLEEATFISQQ